MVGEQSIGALSPFLAFLGIEVWAGAGIWYVIGELGFQIRDPYLGPMVWTVDLGKVPAQQQSDFMVMIGP